MVVGGHPLALATLSPGKRPVTHLRGGLVGARARLEGCGKSHPHRDSMHGPSSP
jgi:hypothetical protein